jgi:hypothetical protein
MIFGSMEPSILQKRPKSFATGRTAFKSSLISLNTRLMGSFFISIIWIFQTYPRSMIIMNMIMQPCQKDCPILMHNPPDTLHTVLPEGH